MTYQSILSESYGSLCWADWIVNKALPREKFTVRQMNVVSQ